MSLGDWKFNCFLVLLFSKLCSRSKKRCVKFSEFWSALMISWQDFNCGSLNKNTFGDCTLHHWINIWNWDALKFICDDYPYVISSQKGSMLSLFYILVPSESQKYFELHFYPLQYTIYHFLVEKSDKGTKWPYSLEYIIVGEQHWSENKAIVTTS